MIFKFIVFVFIISLSACKKADNEIQLSELEKKGKSVYLANCIVCHNTNPNMAGSVGPEIISPSLELLTLRIMKTEYPQGYIPKRKSKLMVKLPQLEKDIPALHAYLNSLSIRRSGSAAPQSN